MRRPGLDLRVLILAAAAPLAAAASPPPRGPAVVEATRELRASGHNYDDPCFWQDPDDPARALGCITSKGAGEVDCFDLETGRFVGAARGFSGQANNCDVDGGRNELVTTDVERGAVLVHELPSLRLARTVRVPGTYDLGGICVGHAEGRSIWFVTDEVTEEVLVVDAVSGEIVRSWAHGLPEAESVACDDEWRRLIVCDDESELHGCRVFTYAGEATGVDFGVGVIGSDAEGVALYRCPERQGYVIVSDQGNDEFEVFRRTDFSHVCTFRIEGRVRQTRDTDGIDVLQSSAFPDGLFGACDDCSSNDHDELDLVPWPAIARACGLRVCPVP
jgi:3-phytase